MGFQPLTHQALAIDHLIAHPIAGLFAGMGLGKTASTLAALDHLFVNGMSKGALIIAPLRVSLFTWHDEAALWFPYMKVVSLRTKEGQAAWDRGEACIYTLNYESLFIPRRNPDTGEVKDHGILGKLLKGKRASQLPVDVVVWDELSKAKNPSSKRIREFRKHRRKFARHWGLTGTPVSESHLDLFGQIRLLDDGATFGHTLGNYQLRYFHDVNEERARIARARGDDPVYPKWEVRPECEGMIEKAIEPIVLTLRSEDWLKIPPTIVEDIDVALPGKVQPLYKKMSKDLLAMMEDTKVKAVNRAVLSGKLRQIVGGAVYSEEIDTGETGVVTELHDAKIHALRALWEREGREPMIVAIQYKHERERILRAFPEAVEFHSDRLADWNAGKIPLLVAHPKSMSHGLNMQSGGTRICWFTMPYSRDDYEQTNARLARQGQKHITRVFRLLSPGTIDDAVVAAIENKGANQAGFMELLARNLRTLREAA